MWLSIFGHVSSYTPPLNQAVPKQCQSKWKKINSTEIFMRATWTGKYLGLCLSPAPGGYKRLKSLTKYRSNQSCRKLKMKSCAWLPRLTIMKFCTCALRKPAHFTLFIWNFPSFTSASTCWTSHSSGCCSCLCCWQAKAKNLLCVISWTPGVALQIMKGEARFLRSCHFPISFFNYL